MRFVKDSAIREKDIGHTSRSRRWLPTAVLRAALLGVLLAHG